MEPTLKDITLKTEEEYEIVKHRISELRNLNLIEEAAIEWEILLFLEQEYREAQK
jgi:hypothetical protein